MKIKHIAIAALVGLGLVSQASAQVHIYGTGSTAFRSETFVSIKALFDGGNPAFASRGGGSGLHANGDNATYMNFTGTIGGTNVIIKCLWNGSEDGIRATATPGALPLTYLTDGAAGIVSSNPTVGELDGSSTAPDFTMADTSQGAAKIQSPVLLLGSNNPVAIVTFKWVKNTNSFTGDANYVTYSRLTNVTHAQLKNLFAGPQIAAFFTGNTNDTNFIYMLGRNDGSGTRVNAEADSGYGTITKPVDQWALNSGNPAASSPAFPLGECFNDGYASGGGVANAMKLDGSARQLDPVDGTTVGWWAFAYVGTSDAVGLPELSLNGVFSTRANIIEGTYSYWGREHLLEKASGLGQFQRDTCERLKTIIPNNLNGTTGIKLSDMHATKAGDFSAPAHN